jgi:hypothetical protein
MASKRMTRKEQYMFQPSFAGPDGNHGNKKIHVALQKLKLCIGYIPARRGKNLLDKLRS